MRSPREWQYRYPSFQRDEVAAPMAKLNQIIAVEKDVKNRTQRDLTDAYR